MMSSLTDDLPALLLRCSGLRNLLFEAGPGPSMGSQARRDHQEGVNRGVPSGSDRVIYCGDCWTVVTANQLGSLATLINIDRPGFAIYPVLRSVIEHSAWLCWMLDESATPYQRLCRANLAYLNTGKGRVATAALIYGAHSEMHDTASQDYEALLSDLRGSFVDINTGRNLCIDGERLPAATQIVRHMGELMGNSDRWNGVYKFLCQMANHPTLSVSEVLVLQDDLVLEIRISHDTLSQNLLSALNPYLWSLNYLCAYLGWPTTALDELFDEFERAQT